MRFAQFFFFEVDSVNDVFFSLYERAHELDNVWNLCLPPQFCIRKRLNCNLAKPP